ncbi:MULTISPECIES: quinol dehydrogenase ferredoxin subunit NapH [unclassified Methylophaga]|jgi:ferredoxin-type protein NapH|uniref:quinol dehydrogenase ferredoxin subunit NapH n=1 Tax=unclassified Methylophaga TaxID=2629249 RepID=UPI00259C81DF|nr:MULTISPECIES: quinol dehydrogenase ferredoxin subunit NapH [unclassified Methylophaga]|tara:strand:- start:5386 stop:6231 length:846 start_codon:yes stop_codon:yes gene_type:complete
MLHRLKRGLYRHRWLLTRRIVQISILLAFIVAIPGYGKIADGNLSSSLWFEQLKLTDPFILLQSFFAGSPIALPALMGAILVGGFYAFFAGRLYCSWVCPINLLTDLAYWLRKRLNVKGNMNLSRHLRLWILALSLVLSFLGGTLAWEIVNPITRFQRELIWFSLSGAMLLGALFLFDLFVSRRAWCGHLCPVGAFYGILGRYGRLKVTSTPTESCDTSGCSRCVAVCPEPHVLAPVVSKQALSVTSSDCTRCGACLDECSEGVLSMKIDLVGMANRKADD